MAMLLGWALALSARQAEACPRLEGRYACAYSPVLRQILVVNERMSDGVRVYTYDGNELRADGRAHAVPDDAEVRGGTMRVWCEGQVARARLTSQFFRRGVYAGELELNFTYERSDTHLRQRTEGQLTSLAGSLPLASDVVCETAR